jgi:putative ABC transport system permease protein
MATLWDLVRAATTERLAAVGRKLGFEPPPHRLTDTSNRRSWSRISMETYRQDARYAVRTLRRSRGFSAVAVATLTLGIGTTVTMFSVVNGVLVEKLPYDEPDRIVMMWGTDADGDFGVSENERLRYRDQPIFEAFGSYQFGTANLQASGDPQRIVEAAIDPEVSAALGITPVIGRSFTREETQEGGDPVALLSYELWQRDFGGNPDILGHTLVLDGRTRTIVGVVPQRFRLPRDFIGQPVQIYVPLVFAAAPDPQNIHYLTTVARLRDGVTVAQARERLRLLSERLKVEFPTLPPTFVAAVVPVRQVVLGGVRPILLMLLGSVALVLLIACVNVANVFLSHAESRTREFAICAALGAGKARIVRQLLTESLALAAIGGALGLVLAALASDMVVRLHPPNLPRVDQIGVDLRVVAFTAAASLLTALLFGLIPAISASRGNLQGALHAAGKSVTAGVRRGRIRRLLVVSEVALAVMLTAGAGLLLRSFMQLQSVKPGLSPTNTLTAQIALPEARYPDVESARAFYRDLLQRIRGMPSVVEAGAITQLPFASDPGDWGIRIEGREEERLASGRRPFADRLIVTPGYFEALEIPLIEGRTLTTADDAMAPPVVLINEETARSYWPGESALGKRFHLSANIDTVYRTVIGVTANVRHRGLGADITPEMYLPHAQHPSTRDFPIGTMSLVIRTAGNPLGLTGQLRQAVSQIDAGIPLARIRTMNDVVEASTAGERFNAVLFAVFGFLGLGLVSIGVYGVMSYFISRRTQEIGIRLALGAAPRSVLGSVVNQGLALTILGTVLGIGGALALGQLMSGLLFGVGWNDMFTFVTVSTLVLAVALLACVVPAVRATRVDPIEVLRTE